MNKNFTFDLQRFADIKSLQNDGNTYYISSVADLKTLAAYVNEGNNCEGLTFKQTQDITFTAADGEFTPIGGENNPFKGTFDGGNFSIENLTIIGEDYQGLFGYNVGTIKEVNLVNAKVSGKNNVGGFVGWNEDGTVSGIMTDGKVSGSWYVGGLVGYNAGGYVIGRSDVGELVGYNSKTGPVSGTGDKPQN